MNNSLEKFIAIKTEDGTVEEVMGKYMYYSLPKLVIKVEKVKEICETIGFPVDISEKVSLTDAFRSATSEIHHRIEENIGDELKNFSIDELKKMNINMFATDRFIKFLDIINQ